MNVLVVAPHPDDEAIGCGGSICLHAARGDAVTVVFLTSGELGMKQMPKEQAWAIREAEALAAAEVLGTKETRFLRLPDWYVGEDANTAAGALDPPILRDVRPGLIYLPHPAEWHPDHRAALPAVSAAVAACGIESTEYRTYEVWTPLTEHGHVEDVTSVMHLKPRAIRCYRSQLGAFRYDRAARGLNQYRGALAGRCEFAEVFGPGGDADG